jgi:hypothetical protein
MGIHNAAAMGVLSAGQHSDNDPPPCRDYQPLNVDDTTMYQLWQQGTRTGREPTGAQLAKAIGRPDDSSGIGRRAIRRYRDARTRSSATAAAAR